MAVYKSTHCYPFLNSLDIRTAKTKAEVSSEMPPILYLKCKIDTSNRAITGYRIRLLDSDNNQIFPADGSEGVISPLEELQTGNMADVYDSTGTNSGINGTYLWLPFFQNYQDKKLNSYNAVYYRPSFLVDHIILSGNLAASMGAELDFAENISNWTKDETSFSGEICLTLNSDSSGDNTENRIRLDGELLSRDQMILVCSDSSDEKVGFYYVDRISQDLNAPKIILRPASDWNQISKKKAVLTTIKGSKKFHNTIWKTETSGITSLVSSTEALWCDCAGNSISGLSVEGNTYKWEITLYQGNCRIAQKANSPKEADYSDISDTDYDMILGTGTICGSYSDRIQIASDDAFSSDGTVNKDAILPGLTSDVLVLQTRYMQLGTISSGKFSGNSGRLYVKSYSDGYGYVYPETSDLNASIVSSATHAQFFKHSNNEDAILDTDIVEYGTDQKLTFLWYDSSSSDEWEEVPSYTEWMDSVSVTSRKIVIGIDNLPEVFPEGAINSKVLLVGQGSDGKGYSYSEQNGVYTLYKLARGSHTYYYLERAASYASWSDFIGKVIYVRNGDLGGKNIQSLAQAGTYTIWNPLSSTENGDSGLGFTEELPILLFQNKLKTGRSYGFFSDSTTYPSTGMLDGENLSVGDTVLCADGSVYIVKTKGASGSWSEYSVDKQGNGTRPSNNDYVYFTHGSGHAERVFIFNESGLSQTWDLHTAKVLHNDAEHTYVSPSAVLRPNMKLKLSHNKKAIFANGGRETSWVCVRDVNETLYCIRHDELVSPTVFSSAESTDNGTPWKYEIRSFFRASDENPFYANEDPHIILYKNEKEYSDLATLKNAEGEYVESSTVAGRSVKLSAKYIQYQGASWESYRWILQNESGDILQDTGKKYDKAMSVIFYGLANDTDSPTIYYATLYIEDDLENTLQHTIKLFVTQSASEALKMILTASYDCDIQAVRLEFQADGLLTPSYRVSAADGDYDYKYVPEVSNLWDNGWKAENGSATITHKDGNDDPLVDYSEGSTISGDDGEPYADSFSRAEKYGLNYYTSFSHSIEPEKVTALNGLKLTTQSEDNPLMEEARQGVGDILQIGENELFFETGFSLNDNFCGDIVSWMLQGTDDENIDQLFVTSGGTSGSKKGYLEFAVSVPDDTKDHFYLTVTGYDSDGLSHSSGKQEFKNEEIPNLCYPWDNLGSMVRKYYLQPSSIVGDTNEYKTGNYEYLHLSEHIYLDSSLYIKKDSKGQCFSGGSYALGNLCLSDYATDSFFTYWVEDRPLLKDPERQEYIGNFETTSNDLIQMMDYSEHEGQDRTSGTADGRQKWPDDTKEESLFWKEGDYKDSSSGTDVYSPFCWEDVSAEDSHVEKMVAMARHYGMSKKKWYLQCFVTDSDTLYSTAVKDNLVIEYLSTDSKTEFLSKYAKAIYPGNEEMQQRVQETLKALMTGFSFKAENDSKLLGFVLLWWTNFLD